MCQGCDFAALPGLWLPQSGAVLSSGGPASQSSVFIELVFELSDVWE